MNELNLYRGCKKILYNSMHFTKTIGEYYTEENDITPYYCSEKRSRITVFNTEKLLINIDFILSKVGLVFNTLPEKLGVLIIPIIDKAKKFIFTGLKEVAGRANRVLFKSSRFLFGKMRCTI